MTEIDYEAYRPALQAMKDVYGDDMPPLGVPFYAHDLVNIRAGIAFAENMPTRHDGLVANIREGLDTIKSAVQSHDDGEFYPGEPSHVLSFIGGTAIGYIEAIDAAV